MWDRFRSTPAAPGHHDSSTSTRQLQLQQQQLHHQQQPGQQGQRLPPSVTNIHNSNTSTSSLLTNPLSNNSNNSANSSNSWQPRSSVIAQRQRQQQPQHRQHNQHHQQQLRSASTDNYYPGSGSAGGYGGYQYTVKGGPPPPRPLRDLCVHPFPHQPSTPPLGAHEIALDRVRSTRLSKTTQLTRPRGDSSEVPPPVQPPARQQTFPQQSSRQQLHPPSAHARHESKDSISGRPPSSVYSQPSPLHTTFAPRSDPPNVVRHQPDALDDISPPSSPELLSPGNVPNLDISPIDEEDDLAYRQPMPKMSAVSGLPSQQQRAASRQGETPSPNARSNIPMMRREKRQQRDAAAGRLRASPSQDAMRETPPREQALRPTDSKERLRQPSPVPQSLKAMDSRERLRQPTVDYSQKPGSSNGRPRGEKNPRWDPMTGEIAMNNEKSRPSQVKPLEFARGFGLGITSTATAERGATSPNPPKSGGMGDRVRQMGSRMGVGSGPKHQPQPQPESNTDPAAAAFTSNRPGWRGASGRTAIVEPVKDNPEVAPLKIPPRSDKRSSPRPFGGPSPSPSPSPSRGLSSPSPSGVRSGDAALSSPPISPETQLREQDQKQQAVGGGGAGKGPLLSPSSLGGTMANTIRRIIPSSQRLPSGAGAGGANATATGVSAGVSGQQGYPSPPLSSSPSHPATLAHQQSAPVNANGGANHATTARIDADAAAETDAHAADTYRSQSSSPLSPSPPPPQSQEQYSSSAEPSPTASQAPIKRKQVGSGGPPSAHLHPGRGAHHQPKESFASSVYSQQTEDASHAQQQRPSDEIAPRPTIDTRNLPGAGNADSPYEQPPSRFSVTTYATSAHTSTPRESLEQFDRNHYNDADAPPLPTPPKDYAMTSYLNNEPARTRQQQQQPKGASVMDRSRPKTRNGASAWDDENEAPVKISLSQPWMSTAGANSAGINAQNSPPRVRKDAPRGPREQAAKERPGLLGLRKDSTNTSRPASILSVDKALPAAPPELSAETTKDRVAILNAQLQSLGNRRININKSIKQMTELMPQDNLMATPEVLRKREMEKRKVDDLQQELADVQREEHELGMKLHRAYKRLDRQADYEPTTLWVRRATGDLIYSAVGGLIVCLGLAYYFRHGISLA